MKITAYRHGEPCWVELGTQDWNSAKHFYCRLFGWQAEDIPMPEGAYTMLQQAHEDIGAMYQLPAELQQQGVPSHWAVYFAVDDINACIEAVSSAGGQLLMGPHEVGSAGKMALFTDPEGAHFSVWQGVEHPGAGRKWEANTLCWVELACRQSELAKTFYPKVFNWQMRRSENAADFEYTEWLLNGESCDEGIGGMLEMTELWGDVPPHWMIYFSVDDCDVMASRAAELGGKVCVPPTDIPNVGRFAVINDPQGAVFSIIRLTMAL